MERPIFIIGSPRSGTTLVRLVLDSHPNISCGPETHFLASFADIIGKHWDTISLYGFDQHYWHTEIGHFFGAFKSDYARRSGKRRWAEKTPQYTLYLEFIDALYPDAQFVHIIRDGRDVVFSHLERWGYRAALRCAMNRWSDYVTKARNFGRALPSSRYFELRYEELVAEPDRWLQSLFEYLEEPWHPAVLHFDRLDHDIVSRYWDFTASRRKDSGETTAIYGSRAGAGGKELDLFLRMVLRVRAGSLLRELNYLSGGGSGGRRRG